MATTQPQPTDTAVPDASAQVERRLGGTRSRGVLWWCGVYLALFAAITIWRWEVIALPPNWGNAISLYLEANYLAESGFDYRRLRYDEKDHYHGGPRVYMTSIAPTLVALGMALAPTTEAGLVIHHLLGFAAGALLATVTLALLVPRIGWWPAGGCALALVTTPLVNVQIDIAGMDLMMSAVAIVVVALAVRGRLLAAGVASAIAFLLKATGLVLTTALIVFAALYLIAGSRAAASRPRFLWSALVFNAALLAVELAVIRWGGTMDVLLDNLDQTIVRGLQRLATADPGVLLVFLLAATLYGAQVARCAWTYRCAGGTEGFVGRMRRLVADQLHINGLATFCWIAFLGLMASMFKVEVLPRYLTLGVVLVYLAFGAAMALGPRRRILAAAGLCIVLVWNVGRLSETVFGGSGADRPGTAERNRLYLTTVRAEQDAMRWVEANCAEAPIVTGYPHSLFLALPRYGYVDRPLGGYMLAGAEVPGFKAYPQLLADAPADAVFIHVGGMNWGQRPSVPPPQPDDEILYHDDLTPPLVVYRKHWDPDAADTEARRHWYLGWVLEQIELIDRAHALLSLGRRDEAIALCWQILNDGAEDGRAHFVLGQCELTVKNPSRAAVHLAAAIEQGLAGDELAKATYGLGLSYLMLGEDRRAVPQLERAVQLKPNARDAQHMLGVAYARIGETAKARHHFSEALRIAPGDVESRQWLGRLSGQSAAGP